MFKKLYFFIILALVFTISVSAQDKSENSPLPKAGSFGIIFNFEGIPIDIGAYDDGMRTGVGIKFCITDAIRIRGLIAASVVAQGTGNDPETSLNIGAAVEYHFKPDVVSPYAGAGLGVRLITIPTADPANRYEWHILILGGAEVQIYKNFSIYAEYAGIILFDENGMNFSLGEVPVGGPFDGDGATLGIIIYLN